MTRSVAETAEIERHKYYLSEQMGYDVGWEYAEHDWEEKHARAWRNGQHQAERHNAEVVTTNRGEYTFERSRQPTAGF